MHCNYLWPISCSVSSWAPQSTLLGVTAWWAGCLLVSILRPLRARRCSGSRPSGCSFLCVLGRWHCLSAEGPTALYTCALFESCCHQPKSRYGLRSFPPGHWQILAQPQWSGPIKIKNWQLEQSQKLERQPRARAGLNDKFHPHEAFPLRLGEVAISSNAQRAKK